ncbi:MAG: thioredoxin domain-containing protein [Bacteroidota bacterium]
MRRSFLLPLALLAALVTLPAFTSAPGDADDPQVYAVVFTADWCPSCKVLDPKLAAVTDDLAAMGVEVIALDLTDAASRRRAKAEAIGGGYGEVYAQHEGATGFALLLSAETKEVLDRIVSTDSEADIRRKARAALADA